MLISRTERGVTTTVRVSSGRDVWTAFIIGCLGIWILAQYRPAHSQVLFWIGSLLIVLCGFLLWQALRLSRRAGRTRVEGYK